MAPVSGFVIESGTEPTLYIAGDTIWCSEVEVTIQIHQPEVITVNAGAAQFLSGGPITMTAEDVVNVCQASPNSDVVAVHMEAINHCLLTRAALREAVEATAVGARVSIPEDGELISL